MGRVMHPISRTRNIGISAHIDSGKTTLTERILFYTGQISTPHEVRGKDGVGAKMDSTELEIQKGITIQSAATYCTWNDHTINIIDTPGHVDFTIEVERALRVLDGAILVLCSVAGVQSQSITVDRQMRRYNVPCIAFVNKCDRPGADPLRVAAQLRDELGHNAVMIQHPIGLGPDHEGVIDLVRMRAHYFDGTHGQDVRTGPVPEALLEQAHAQREVLVETLAELDDCVATLFLEGEEIAAEVLDAAIKRATRARTLTAVCLGSAYKNKGVQPLLDDVVRYLPSPLEMEYEALDQDEQEACVALEPSAQEPLVMLAFKLEDGRYGQLTYCRIYQGSVNKGDVIFNMSAGRQKRKVGRLVQMHSDEMHEIDSARAGDIVALFGIECASGDTFTDGTLHVTMASMFVPDVVVRIAVEPHEQGNMANFSKAISRFTKEDPTFRVTRDPESGQTIFGGMGELHLEVYIERIKREYGVDVRTGQPQVAYREALTKRVAFEYTHSKQTGGRGQYARVCGYLEPSDGAQYEFVNEIVGGAIPKEHHAACARGFEDGMAQGGLIGFPMVNLRVCVQDGKAHAEDSSDQAFYTAARAALRAAYMQGAPVILEPVMRVVVESPEAYMGAVMGGLNRRRGTILDSTIRLTSVTITALVPLTEMFGYSNDLRSSTQGKAEFSMEFEAYAPVPSVVQRDLIERYNT